MRKIADWETVDASEKLESSCINRLSGGLKRAEVLDMSATAQHWRESYRSAMEEFDSARQKPLVDRARTAIFDRLLALCDLSDSHQDEEKLLEEALRQLWMAENGSRYRN